ncbi:MAG: AraC family transcriptional regulator [Gemmiger sp.]|nr:AraC family transcriptional regulator [Gemmiger sp.]
MQKEIGVEYKHYYMPYKLPLVAEIGNTYTEKTTTGSAYIFHNYLELGYCHEGSGVLVVDDTEYPFRCGDISIVSPFVMHYNYTSSSEPCRCEYLKMDVDRILSGFSDAHTLGLRESLFSARSFNGLVKSEQSSMIQPLVKNILAEVQTKDRFYEASIRGYCMTLLMACLRLNAAVPPSDQPLSSKMIIRRAIIYIDEHYNEEIRLLDLAALCDMSETHFCRLFRELIGSTPHNYINRIRIHKACSLLYAGRLSIAQVAQRIGFGTLSSFNRNFLHVTGFSPSQWLQLMKTGDDNPAVLHIDSNESPGPCAAQGPAPPPK